MEKKLWGQLGIKWVAPVTKLGGNGKCAVVIPVYKAVEDLGVFEAASINRTISILGGKYDIVLLCSKLLDAGEYSQKFGYNFFYVKVADAYFKSRKSYSDLCEEWQFYDAFKIYEYILICQPDAWVFEDRLDYFVSLGYDYIGAIHMLRRDGSNGHVGNGGFSLRRVEAFINTCKTGDFSKLSFNLYEDCAFCNRFKDKLNIAPPKVGFEFGWQENPQAAMNKIGKLPFGCHNPAKNSWATFWKNYIQTTDKEFNPATVKAVANVDKIVPEKRYTVSNTVHAYRRNILHKKLATFLNG